MKNEPKIGDIVIGNSSYRGYSSYKIARFTPTTAILDDNTKLRLPITNKSCIGATGGYGTTYYQLATPELLEKYERQVLCRKAKRLFDNTKWEALPSKKINELISTLTTTAP